MYRYVIFIYIIICIIEYVLYKNIFIIYIIYILNLDLKYPIQEILINIHQDTKHFHQPRKFPHVSS